MAVLSFYAEVLDEALPEHDPQEAVFRLLLAVLEQTAAVESDTVQPWMPLTYFSLWMTRLMGLLPDIWLIAQRAAKRCRPAKPASTPTRDGLFCASIATATQAALGRLLATCAADVARAGNSLCRRALAPATCSGPAAVHFAGPGTASGAQAAER